MNICVLSSGRGSNLKHLIRAEKLHQFSSKIVLVISNNFSSGALELARKNKIADVHLSQKLFKTEKDFTKTFLKTLRSHKIDFIIMSGYMKLLQKEITHAYRNRIINVHPSLMPAFCGEGYYGMKVHEAVIASGVKASGATVHLVDEKYDHGEIIMQHEVKVSKNETPESLRKKVLRVENKLLAETIRLFESKKIKVRNRKVTFA